MFVTIWMCTQEWSLISSRTTAFTFATCHQPLSWSSPLTRSITCASLRLPRSGTRIRICATASSGVSRVSRSASAETGSSIRSWVWGSSPVSGSSSANLRRSARGHGRLGGTAELEVHDRPGKRDERDRHAVGDDAAEPGAEEVGKQRG